MQIGQRKLIRLNDMLFEIHMQNINFSLFHIVQWYVLRFANIKYRSIYCNAIQFIDNNNKKSIMYNFEFELKKNTIFLSFKHIILVFEFTISNIHK